MKSAPAERQGGLAPAGPTNSAYKWGWSLGWTRFWSGHVIHFAAHKPGYLGSSLATREPRPFRARRRGSARLASFPGSPARDVDAWPWEEYTYTKVCHFPGPKRTCAIWTKLCFQWLLNFSDLALSPLHWLFDLSCILLFLLIFHSLYNWMMCNKSIVGYNHSAIDYDNGVLLARFRVRQ